MGNVSLLLLLGLAIAALMRRRSAALRHALLAAAIVAAIVTPAFEMAMPSWHLPAGVSQVGASMKPFQLVLPLDATIVDVANTTATRVESSSRGWVWAHPIRTLWMVGSVLSVVLLLVGLVRLGRLASRSTVISEGPWRELADRISRGSGISRPVRILRSADGSWLATWGLARPTIIVPHDASTWSDDRIRLVLAHELAHIDRHDWIWQMLATVLCAIYWFNPLTWIVRHRLRQESELACDDAVLALGVAAQAYATELVELARTLRQRREMLPAVAMARRSHLEQRVIAMLKNHVSRTPATPTAAAGFMAVLLVVAMLLSSLAAAQGSAAFSGSLVDAVGRPLPNAPLTLVYVPTQRPITAIGDSTGRFSFSGLAAGDYLLETELNGFARAQGRLTLAAGQQLTQDIALQIGGLEEAMTVRASTPPPAPSPPRTAPSKQADDPCTAPTAAGCIQPPNRLRNVVPLYPSAERDAAASGRVDLDGRIGTDGYVKDLRLADATNSNFAASAADAVRQWQFSATRLDGVPVEANIHITVHFVAP